MPRKAWTLPGAIIAALETEAARRLKSNERLMHQSRTLGSVSKDLAVACIVVAFGQVRHMTKEELDACLQIQAEMLRLEGGLIEIENMIRGVTEKEKEEVKKDG